MRVNFYEAAETQIPGEYSIKALTIDSISVQGEGNDTVFYNNSKKLSSINLPLKKFDTQSVFEIRFNNVTDNVTVNYTNSEPYFLSLECGCEILPVIESITSTHNFIDSIEIVNREIRLNSSNVEHIKIYHFN
jgi:hypothetical protein